MTIDSSPNYKRKKRVSSNWYSFENKVITNLKVNDTLDSLDTNICHEKKWDHILYYFKNKVVWFIEFSDSTLKNIWNINSLHQIPPENPKYAFMQWIFSDSYNIKLKFLWTHMMRIFFIWYCRKWEKIKMRVENSKIIWILKKLQNQWVIQSYNKKDIWKLEWEIII